GGGRGRRFVVAETLGRVLRGDRDFGLPAVGDPRSGQGHHHDSRGVLRHQRRRGDLPADLEAAVRNSRGPQGLRRGKAWRATSRRREGRERLRSVLWHGINSATDVSYTTVPFS